MLGYPTGIVPVTRVRSEEAVGRKPSRDVMEQAAYKVELGSAGLLVTPHPYGENRRILATTKNNLSAPAPNLTY